MRGFLLIADITGYTVYLNESELEHAREVLHDLIQLLIEETRSPLRISRLEGDAVISHAPEGSFAQGQTLLDQIERTYVAFRRALALMEVNTNCPCNACRNIPKLDLKFFIHHGTYTIDHLGDQSELVGADVNLVHRITKNSVTEETGQVAYAAYTRRAVDALDLEEFTRDLPRVDEHYEHLGDVEIIVQDMSAVWEEKKDRDRVTVSEADAITVVEYQFSIPPVALWEYLQEPDYRAMLTNADRADLENTRHGRVAEGSVFQCAHGDTIMPQTIVDYQPFDQQTFHTGGPLASNATFHLQPHNGGTRLRIVAGPVQKGNPIFRWIGNLMMRYIWQFKTPERLQRFKETIKQDLERDAEPAAELFEFDAERVGDSIRAALEESNTETPG